MFLHANMFPIAFNYVLYSTGKTCNSFLECFISDIDYLFSFHLELGLPLTCLMSIHELQLVLEQVAALEKQNHKQKP